MENPYRPPNASLDVDEAAGPRTPVIVVVFGILNLIFGGMGLLCSPIGLLPSVARPPEQATGNLALDIVFNDPGFRMGTISFSVLSTAFGGLLLVAGVGLLRRRPWGRSLSIGYGIADTVGTLAHLALLGVVLIAPILSTVHGDGRTPAIAEAITIVVGSLLGLIYPVLLLVVMLLPRVKRTFATSDRGGS